MTQGPFRVRRAGALAPFEEVGLVGGSAESIERAIGFVVCLDPGNIVLRRVIEIGPPVLHGIVIAGFYDGLSGPHEAFPARGEDITQTIVAQWGRPTLRLVLLPTYPTYPRNAIDAFQFTFDSKFTSNHAEQEARG